MDATRRQRALRAIVLMVLGFACIFLASLDPARAIRDPSFVLLSFGMLAWTVGENVSLQQDEPQDYHGKRNTRMLQGAMMLTGVVASLDRYQLHIGPLPPSLALGVAGAMLVLAGGALRVVAIRTLDKHFRYELRVEEGQRVVDHGIFRRIRHPSYLGLWLITLGIGLSLASLVATLAGGAVLLALLSARIRAEERVLVASFGGAYEDYRRRSWRMLPPIY